MEITFTIPKEMIERLAEKFDLTIAEVEEAILKYYEPYQQNGPGGLLEEHLEAICNF